MADALVSDPPVTGPIATHSTGEDPIVSANLQVRLGTLELQVDLELPAGEVVAVLGPNGAGKTTVLRTLSGLQRLDSGLLRIDRQVVDEPSTGRFIPTRQRPVGVVFQDHLLFPHLSVLENVAFGPRATGTPAARARAEAMTWLGRMGLEATAQDRPAALSGGQAQRVSLARALATDPRLLLLDEPLAALDAGTRNAVRRDLRRHLSEFSGATILVTHDPLDALALADRIVILEAGRVVQRGTIEEVTSRPRSTYVADLIGVNLLRGDAGGTTVQLRETAGQVITADRADGPVLALIHPHSVALQRARFETSAQNQWAATITGFDLLGDRVRVRLDGDVPLVAEVTPAAVRQLDLVEGTQVWATVKATEVTVYPDGR